MPDAWPTTTRIRTCIITRALPPRALDATIDTTPRPLAPHATHHSTLLPDHCVYTTRRSVKEGPQNAPLPGPPGLGSWGEAFCVMEEPMQWQPAQGQMPKRASTRRLGASVIVARLVKGSRLRV